VLDNIRKRVMDANKSEDPIAEDLDTPLKSLLRLLSFRVNGIRPIAELVREIC